MAIPTESWSESTPSGSDNIALGDNKIRQMKTQIREIMEVDHEFPSSGQSDTAGQHKQITLQEQADIGSGSEGYTALGAQTINDKPELVYTDEDDNDIQLTDNGEMNWKAVGNRLMPIGFVVTLGVSTDPATLFGFGTWTPIEGKVIVGLSSEESEFDTLNETGGEKTHTLSTDEMPSHDHTGTYNTVTSGYDYMEDSTSLASVRAQNVSIRGTRTSNVTAQGGGSAHNNIQPYIVKYVWERTA